MFKYCLYEVPKAMDPWLSWLLAMVFVVLFDDWLETHKMGTRAFHCVKPCEIRQTSKNINA